MPNARGDTTKSRSSAALAKAAGDSRKSGSNIADLAATPASTEAGRGAKDAVPERTKAAKAASKPKWVTPLSAPPAQRSSRTGGGAVSEKLDEWVNAPPSPSSEGPAAADRSEKEPETEKRARSTALRLKASVAKTAEG